MRKTGLFLLMISFLFGVQAASADFFKIQKGVAPPSGPSDGKSLLLVASGRGMGDDTNMLFVDKAPSGDLENFTYNAVEVEPGPHLVWIYINSLDRVTARWVTVQAGETKYLLFGRLGLKAYNAMTNRQEPQLRAAALGEITPDQFQTLLEGGKNKDNFARLQQITLTDEGSKQAAGKEEKNYGRAAAYAGDPAGFPYQTIAAGDGGNLKVAAGLCAYADAFNPDQWTSAHVHRVYLAQVVNPSSKDMAGKLVVLLPGGSSKIESPWTKVPANQEGILTAEVKGDIPWGKPFHVTVQLADNPKATPAFAATLDLLLPAAQKQVFEDKQKVDVLVAGPVKITGFSKAKDDN